MPNLNCLEGIQGPPGGPEERFVITTTITRLVTDKGSDPVGNHSGDDDSPTYGSDGGYQAALMEYRA